MPLQRDLSTGKLITVEQSTPEHILSQETSVALCPAGFRAERPDFGWPQPYMRRTPPDPRPLVEALDRLVPSVVRRTAEAYMAMASDPTHWVEEVDSEVNT